MLRTRSSVARVGGAAPPTWAAEAPSPGCGRGQASGRCIPLAARNDSAAPPRARPPAAPPLRPVLRGWPLCVSPLSERAFCLTPTLQNLLSPPGFFLILLPGALSAPPSLSGNPEPTTIPSYGLFWPRAVGPMALVHRGLHVTALGQPESQVRLFSGRPDVIGTNISSHFFGSQDKAYQKDQVATPSVEKSSLPLILIEKKSHGLRDTSPTHFQDPEVDKAGSV